MFSESRFFPQEMGHLPGMPGSLSWAFQSLDPSTRHPSAWWQDPRASKEEADLGQGHVPLPSSVQETSIVGRRCAEDTARPSGSET